MLAIALMLKLERGLLVILASRQTTADVSQQRPPRITVPHVRDDAKTRAACNVT